MRVMILIKATKDSEAGKMPSQALLAAMTKYNEELVNAGIMVDGGGLAPSGRCKRVRFDGPKRTVVDGPFAETKELVSGYWVWNVDSMEQALDWVRRIPNPENQTDAWVEIRPFLEASDFGEAFTPELQAKEEELRQRSQKK